MANTYTNLHYHVIFSTKNREPWIRQEFETRIWEYIGGIARDIHAKPIQIGGTDDHLHILLGLPPSISVSEALKKLKGGSSGWIKENFAGCRGFSWQDGYGGFTVSQSQVQEVTNYIATQREHHRFKSYQEEYLAFLDKNGIAYDKKYLWD